MCFASFPVTIKRVNTPNPVGGVTNTGDLLYLFNSSYALTTRPGRGLRFVNRHYAFSSKDDFDAIHVFKETKRENFISLLQRRALSHSKQNEMSFEASRF